MSLALDLTIRRATTGRRSLDDVMRALWERYGKSGTGVPEEGVEQMAEEVSGLSLGAFFDQAVRGTEDLPLAELLADVGVVFALRAAESQEDKGGKPASAAADKPRADLGVRTVPEAGGCKLTHVFEGGAAQAAGLAAGDVVVAVNGLRVGGDKLAKLVGAHRVPEAVTVHAFRRDELMQFQVELKQAPLDTCVLELLDDVDGPTQARREAWLGCMTLAPAEPND